MKATILCDDSSFAAKARALLRRVGGRPMVNVRWAIKTWRVDALHHPRLSEKALSESADAHLIIIPAKHARALSTHLRAWLNRWAVLRQLRDAAVAVIDDAASRSVVTEVCLELMLLVERHGLNLIHDKLALGADGTKLSGRYPLKQEQPLAIRFTHLPGTPMFDVFRGYGINE
jgi:hypothetical protein